MKWERSAIIGASLLLASCVTAPVEHHTASGKPEVTVAATPESIKPQLVSQMLSAGYRINRDTVYELSFDRPVDNLAVAVLMGSKYDAQPNSRISFSFAPIGGQTRIVADAAIITNPGSAFERRTPTNNGVDSQSIQQYLDRLKAETDPNSSISIAKRNGIVLGVHTVASNEAAKYGQLTTSTRGLVVISVDGGGAAEKAGVHGKDVLLSVAGRPVDTNEQLVDVLAAQKPGSTVDLEIIHDGTPETLKVAFAKPTAQVGQRR